MLMDSAISCFHFRKIHPPISLKITIISQIRNTLAITLTDLLKKDLNFTSNIFYGPFNADFAAANAFFVVIIIISSSSSSISSSSSSSRNSSNNSSSGGGGASDSGINSTSSCDSSKILTWTGKYKPVPIAWAWDDKYTLGARAGK